MLAVIVTVKVQLSNPEFMIIYWLPHVHIISLRGQRYVQWSEPEYWLCFSVGFYSTWLWIQTSILSCGTMPKDWHRSLIFLPYYRWGNFVIIVFGIMLHFLMRYATEQMEAIGSACPRALWIIQTSPPVEKLVTCGSPWALYHRIKWIFGFRVTCYSNPR